MGDYQKKESIWSDIYSIHILSCLIMKSHKMYKFGSQLQAQGSPKNQMVANNNGTTRCPNIIYTCFLLSTTCTTLIKRLTSPTYMVETNNQKKKVRKRKENCSIKLTCEFSFVFNFTKLWHSHSTQTQGFSNKDYPTKE